MDKYQTGIQKISHKNVCKQLTLHRYWHEHIVCSIHGHTTAIAKTHIRHMAHRVYYCMYSQLKKIFNFNQNIIKQMKESEITIIKQLNNYNNHKDNWKYQNKHNFIKTYTEVQRFNFILKRNHFLTNECLCIHYLNSKRKVQHQVQKLLTRALFCATSKQEL